MSVENEAMLTGPEIGKSALIIVDMQNDLVHPEGDVGVRAREKWSFTTASSSVRVWIVAHNEIILAQRPGQPLRLLRD